MPGGRNGFIAAPPPGSAPNGERPATMEPPIESQLRTPHLIPDKPLSTIMREGADEIMRLKQLLSAIDTTMCVHGKVDAGTDLHDRIQRAYGVE